jgi:hypothetical protein
MILMALETGQHVVPAPAGEAELAPVIVVGRRAAHMMMALMADEPPITSPRG